MASFLDNSAGAEIGLTFADLIYESARLAPEDLEEANLIDAEAIGTFLFREWRGASGPTLRAVREMQAQGFEVSPSQERFSDCCQVGGVQIVIAVGWDNQRVTEFLRIHSDVAIYTTETTASSLGMPSGVYIVDIENCEEPAKRAENQASLIEALLPDADEMVEFLPTSLSRSYRVRKLLRGNLLELCKSELFDRMATGTAMQAGSLAGAKMVGAIGFCFFGPAGGLVGGGIGQRLGRLPISRAANWLKEKTLLRSQFKDLMGTLSTYLQAACTLADATNRVFLVKQAIVQKALETNLTLGPLKKSFLWKLNDERAFRERKLAELQRAKGSPECLSGSGVLQCADEAALLVRQAGVHCHGVRVEAEAVKASVERYNMGQSKLGLGS